MCALTDRSGFPLINSWLFHCSHSQTQEIETQPSNPNSLMTPIHCYALFVHKEEQANDWKPQDSQPGSTVYSLLSQGTFARSRHTHKGLLHTGRPMGTP